MKILVVLEFDENDLGPKWMNPDNLATLLYTDAATREDLLKVVKYEEASPPDSTIDKLEKIALSVCYCKPDGNGYCDTCIAQETLNEIKDMADKTLSTLEQK